VGTIGGSREAAYQLVAQLGDPAWEVRSGALGALRECGSSCLEALIAGLAHPNPHVRLWCAELMDHLADDRCAGPLAAALHDPSPRVRRHAVHSLGCQRCKPMALQVDVVALLCATALQDPSMRVRRVAVHQLGLQPHDARAVAALEAIIRRDTDQQLLSRARFALATQTRQRPAPPAAS
jgi:HEAT repeat protein